VLSIICLATPAWADLQSGWDAYGRGDHATALREWRPLAEQGVANAQYNLGLLYAKGQGVPQEYEQVRQRYEKAAAQGNANAQYKLGVLYGNGQGGAQDNDQARQWWEKAAAQEDPRAQYSLGFLYHSGYYVPQDFVQAYKWYSLAAANGHKDAATLRGVLANQMSHAQITKAQRLAQEWKLKTP
jgi:TPR repeat protein